MATIASWAAVATAAETEVRHGARPRERVRLVAPVDRVQRVMHRDVRDRGHPRLVQGIVGRRQARRPGGSSGRRVPLEDRAGVARPGQRRRRSGGRSRAPRGRDEAPSASAGRGGQMTDAAWVGAIPHWWPFRRWSEPVRRPVRSV